MNWITFEQIKSTTSGMAGQALLINPSGTDFEFKNAPSGVANAGAIDTYASPYGATVTGNVLYLQTASGGGPGLVSTGTQEFAGNKTFLNTLITTTGNITTVNSTLVDTITVDASFVQHSGGDMHIGTQSVNSLALKTSGTLRWVVGPSDGEFRPMSTDRYDLGSTTYQIRNIYSNALLNNNTLSVGTSGANANVLFIANSLLKWTLNTGDDFYPAGSGTAYVGLTTNPLAGVYTQRCYSPAVLTVGTTTSNNMNLITNNSTRWQISGTGGALVPFTSDTFDIGSTGSQVRNIYTNAVLNNNTLSVGTSGSNTNLLFITNSTLRWTMNTGDDFYPATNNAANLGLGNNSLASIYTSNVYNSSTATNMSIGTLHPNRSIVFITASATRWVMNAGGEFYPNTSGTDTLGLSTTPLAIVYTNTVTTPNVDTTIGTTTANRVLYFKSGGSNRWAVSGTVLLPVVNGNDLGTAALKAGNLYTTYVGDSATPASYVYTNAIRCSGTDLTMGSQAGDVRNVWITITGYNKYVWTGDYYRPQVNNTCFLGSTSYQFNSIYSSNYYSQNTDTTLGALGNDSVGSATWIGSTTTANTYVDQWYIGPGGALSCANSDGQNAIGLSADYRPSNVYVKTGVYVGGTKLNVPYTATHYYVFASGVSAEEGDCLVLVSGKVEPCITASAINCAGILTSYVIDGNEQPLSDLKDSLCVYYPSGTTIHEVATAGDSRVIDSISGAKICNLGGDVEVGDLLVTAGVSGYLMKQHDDIIRSCTVAKLMEPVSFSPEGTASGVYVYLYCS